MSIDSNFLLDIFYLPTSLIHDVCLLYMSLLRAGCFGHWALVTSDGLDASPDLTPESRAVLLSAPNSEVYSIGLDVFEGRYAA